MAHESDWDPGSETFEKQEAATQDLDDKRMRSKKIYSVCTSNPVCTVDPNLRQISCIYSDDLAFQADKTMCATQR